MDSREARAFLSLHREGDLVDDPRFAEAARQAAADPELARWWREEQELDRLIAANLMNAPVPPRAATPLIASAAPQPITQRNWQRAALLAAAAMIALAVLFVSWRGALQPAPTLADFRDEMIGFIKVTPALELETSDLTRAINYLEESGAPSQLAIPSRLRDLDLVGCRTLRYRGHNVTLLCFKRDGGRIAHLLVVDREVVRGLPAKSDADFAREGEWITAGWEEGGRAYLLAMQGEQSAAEQFIRGS